MEIKYKVYSFRLNEGTIELLKEMRAVKGVSWNKFIYGILKDHASLPHNKILYRNDVFSPKYRIHRKSECEECGAKHTRKKDRKTGCIMGITLCVHHIDADIMNNSVDNLKTLCARCHGKQFPK